jgi:hypothetical protein
MLWMVLSSHICLCLIRGLLPSVFQIKIFYTFLISSIGVNIPFPYHLPWFNHPNKYSETFLLVICGSTQTQTAEADGQVKESSFKIRQFWGVCSY